MMLTAKTKGKNIFFKQSNIMHSMIFLYSLPVVTFVKNILFFVLFVYTSWVEHLYSRSHILNSCHFYEVTKCKSLTLQHGKSMLLVSISQHTMYR